MKKVDDDRQHDREPVGQPHREEAVLADEEVARQAPRHVREERDHQGIEVAVEQPLLEQVHERPGAEHAHELVERVEHAEQDRPAPDGVDREAPEPPRDALAGREPLAREAPGHLARVSEQRLVVARQEGRRLRRRRGVARRAARARAPRVVGHRQVVARHARVRERLHERRRRPWPRVATVARTGTPSARSRPATSRRMPRASASSCMLRTSTVRTSSWPSWQGQEQRAPQVLGVGHLHHDRPRLVRAASARARSVTRSSSLRGRSELRPGESITSRPSASPPAVDLDRCSRVVGDRGAQAGERVEEGALADVRVAEEHDAAAGVRPRRPRDRGDGSQPPLPVASGIMEIVFNFWAKCRGRRTGPASSLASDMRQMAQPSERKHRSPLRGHGRPQTRCLLRRIFRGGHGGGRSLPGARPGLHRRGAGSSRGRPVARVGRPPGPGPGARRACLQRAPRSRARERRR